MHNSRLSVALCTYNGATYLDAQLRSITAQDRRPDEVVICDDCSSDTSLAIAERFAADAAFGTRIIRNKATLGAAKNFEKAIALCSGDLIALADQDDVWRRDKLAVIERELEAKPYVELVFSNGDLIDELGNSTGGRLWDITFTPRERRFAQRGDLLRVLAQRNVATGATMVFRARARDLVLPLPDDGVRLHDAWIALLIAAARQVSWIDESLVDYRRHVGQAIGVGAREEAQRKRPHEETRARTTAMYSDDIRQMISTAGVLSNVARDPRRANYARALEASVAYLAEVELHLRLRRDLPRKRMRRIPPVVQELSRGRYRRYSRGVLSAAKDIVRPRATSNEPSATETSNEPSATEKSDSDEGADSATAE